MKKMTSLLLSLAFTGSVVADMSVVTVDMNRLLLETTQGQELQKEVQAEAQKVQENQQKAVQELTAQRDALQKQAKALSASALQQKQMDLAMHERRLDRDLRGQTEDLQLFAKQKENELRAEMNQAVSEIAEAKEWGAVFDRSASGFMAGAKNAQVDEELILEINERAKKEVLVASATDDKSMNEATDDVHVG